VSAGKPRGLGRGLGALIPGASTHPEERVEYVPIHRIRPGPYQPRQAVDPKELGELAESVRSHGVLQPIVVRPVSDGYEVVAGERRWRAAAMAGLDSVPAVVRQVGDLQALAIALVENLQRQDLNPVERARAYRRLVEEFGLTQEEVARTVGRSQPSVANALRLLSLPPEVLQLVERGELTEAHARVLLSVEDPHRRLDLAHRAASKHLPVRQLAQLASDQRAPQRRRRAKTIPSDPNRQALEDALRSRLATQVRVRRTRKGGVLEIEFYSEEDFGRICEVILGGPIG
jgi:ParB family chromosome partitioning protein